MVKFKFKPYWYLWALWPVIQHRPGIFVFYYYVWGFGLYAGDAPGRPTERITGAAWRALHRDTYRFYILIGERPARHLLVVEGIDQDCLQLCIEYIGEMYGIAIDGTR